MIPRYVWFFWGQGWDATPWFIKLNFLSWRVRNPQWSVIFLDNTLATLYSDADQVVERNKTYITPTSFSDVLRIDLLHRYGGVWVDATTVCVAALDPWINDTTSASNFFCFRNSCPDRDIASWFMAAHPGNRLVDVWRGLVRDYWENNVFDHQNSAKIDRNALRERLCSSMDAAQGWFDPIVLSEMRVFPYFWFHYLHARAVRNDADAASTWALTPVIYGGDQAAFLRRSPLDPLDNWASGLLARPNLRLLKLERRTMPESPPAGSTLEAIYRDLMELPIPAALEAPHPAQLQPKADD